MNMKRVSIYLGDKCNLSCKYCMRHNINKYGWNEILELSDNVKQMLTSRTKDNCEAVIVTGGEPLFYFNKIQKIFNLVPQEVHKKIITNGTLLTQEIVDFCNDLNIEVNLSHDGEYTEYTRGVDVLQDENLLHLIKQINVLTISCVVTNRNNDVYKNYMYIQTKINRNVFMTTSTVSETGYNGFLIEGFDYDLYMKSHLEYIWSPHFVIPEFYRLPRCQTRGVNILMNGECVDLTTLRPLGCTIEDTFEHIVSRVYTIARPCPFEKCIYKRDCTLQKQLRSEHMCRSEQVAIKISKQLERNLKLKGLM